MLPHPSSRFPDPSALGDPFWGHHMESMHWRQPQPISSHHFTPCFSRTGLELELAWSSQWHVRPGMEHFKLIPGQHLFRLHNSSADFMVVMMKGKVQFSGGVAYFWRLFVRGVFVKGSASSPTGRVRSCFCGTRLDNSSQTGII